MQVKEIEKKQLDEMVPEPALPAGQFLQSKFWLEFQSMLGRETVSLGVYDNEDLIATAFLIRYNFPMGKKYFNCIRGPLVKVQSPKSKVQINDQIPNSKFQNLKSETRNPKLETNPKSQIQNSKPELRKPNYEIRYKEIVQQIVEYVREKHGNNVLFMRIEPPVASMEFKKWHKGIGIKKVKTAYPKRTIVLDFKKSEEELLKAMHQKWRYNIRLAERKGVQIEKCNDIDEFYVLAKVTENRDKIKLFGKNYFVKLWQLLSEKQAGDFFVARYNGEVISAIINVYYGNTAVYFYGASSDKHRNVMPNHLIQWQAIKEAKKRGLEYYDFWGIAETDDPKDSWAGVTRFKRGFGGQEASYGQSYDFIFNPFWYKMYNIVRKFYKL